MGDLWADGLRLLRYEPTEMRLLASSGGRELVDTDRAVLVWEPRRVVASYAVPVAELRAELTESSVEPVPAPEGLLHPGIPFAAHSCPGRVVDVAGLAGAGFRPDDAELLKEVRDLAGLVSFFDDVLDVYVDGKLRDRPGGPLAESLRQEFGVS